MTSMPFDANNVKTTDWGVLGCAAALLLFSLPDSFVTAEISAEGEMAAMLGEFDSYGINAWSSYASLGVLLLLAVGALAAARVFAGVVLPMMAVGWNLVLAGAAAVGTLLLLVRAFTYSIDGADMAGISVDTGPGWSGWLVLLLAVAETVFAVLAFRDSGESVPWQQGQQSRP